VVGQAPMDHVIVETSSPGAAIPDNKVQGLSDVIQIPLEGKVAKLKVKVDISHNNIANLRVELLSPSGKRAILHNRVGLGKKNLVKTYDSKSTAALTAFIGQPLKGSWILKVEDLTARNTGMLNSWSLEVNY